MKKFTFLIALVVACIQANAQTDQGRIFVGVDSNLGFSSSSFEGTDDNVNTFAIDLHGGYFLIDNLLAGVQTGFTNFSQGDNSSRFFRFGPFARYYYENVFAGAGIVFSDGNTETEFGDFDSSGNDLSFELGYAAFINDYVSVEPSLSYSIGGGDFDGNNVFSLNIGFAIYLP